MISGFTKNIMLLAAVAVILAGSAAAQQRSQRDGDVGILPVRGNVYMAVGSGGNTTVQIGNDGVLVVDTMTAAAADKLLAAIRTLSQKPIHWIINTSINSDHTGGNAMLAAAGRHIEGDAGASIRAYGTVLQRMMSASNGPNAVPLNLWPTDVYVVEQWDTFVNGEPVLILHQPAAHTDGDSLVMFRRSDVISTGDVFTPDRYPSIDLQKGGSINGLLAGLNHILKLTVPETNQEGGTMVIPGHGHLCDEADVADYRDMVTIVRDRVQNMVNKHMTLDQVRAAHLTRDYDGIYASSEYTGDMFIETVYRSLTQPVNTLPRSK